MKPQILAFCGSIRKNSSNYRILNHIASAYEMEVNIHILEGLTALPFFNPDDDIDCTNAVVNNFRKKINESDAVIFCTPEYVFSIPGVLKNALEWLVSTTLLLDKPVAIITASSLGEKGHESLQLVLKTLGGLFNENTSFLVSGVRAKVNNEGVFSEKPDRDKVKVMMNELISLIQQAR